MSHRFCICTIVFLFALGCAGNSPQKDSLHPKKGSLDDLAPLWKDNYVPLNEGVPPWPRGIAGYTILEHADRLVVGTLNAYRSADGTFHGQRVLGVLVYDDPDEVQEIVARLIDCTRGIPTQSEEGFPIYGLRVFSHSENNTELVLDLLIAPAESGMFSMVPNEIAFCVVDRDIKEVLADITAGLPRPTTIDEELIR